MANGPIVSSGTVVALQQVTEHFNCKMHFYHVSFQNQQGECSLPSFWRLLIHFDEKPECRKITEYLFLRRIYNTGWRLTSHEKCVMCISSRMLLWLEQSIKIPE